MRKKKSVSETECKECGYDPVERYGGGMMKRNKADVKLAKEYCVNSANSDQTIKPIWNKCCGSLSHYSVKLDIRKKEKK